MNNYLVDAGAVFLALVFVTQVRYGVIMAVWQMLISLLVFLVTVRFAPVMLASLQNAESPWAHATVYLFTALAVLALSRAVLTKPLGMLVPLRMHASLGIQLVSVPFTLISFLVTAMLLLQIIGPAGQELLGVGGSWTAKIINPIQELLLGALTRLELMDIQLPALMVPESVSELESASPS